MDELSLPEEPPEWTQKLMAAAAKQFHQLRSGAGAVVQDFVRKVVRRVVVYSDRIEVEVGKQKMRAALTGEPHPSSSRSATREKGSSDVLRLEIEARVKRCGSEMRLVLPVDPLGGTPSHPASSLLKALARARQWNEWIVTGEVSGQRAIAQRLDLDERYVSRVLGAPFSLPTLWMRSSMDGSPPICQWRD